MKPQSSINLHIEELVLHGFASGDKHGISEAVQSELTRLISEQQNSPPTTKSISRDHVDGGNFCVVNSAKPNAVGAQIAGAVFVGINL